MVRGNANCKCCIQLQTMLKCYKHDSALKWLNCGDQTINMCLYSASLAASDPPRKEGLVKLCRKCLALPEFG